MKIFFFSTVFAPSVGGIERQTETLCTQFTELGHEVRLATLTPGDGAFPFEVIRRPGLRQFLDLLRWCDVHVQANVSLKYAWPATFWRHKMIYRHGNAYQADDGSVSLNDRIKRVIARSVSGITNSEYSIRKIGCNNLIGNSYDDAVFTASKPWDQRAHDIAFLGRLVSQKGCDTLLQALVRLGARGLRPLVSIIGDGADRAQLAAFVEGAGLAGQVRFAGVLTGDRLAATLNDHRFLAVPSRCEEGFGIVALEGLACGCVPIVSRRGGLVDAIGPHGFTFENGDDRALAEVLEATLSRPDAAVAKLANVQDHLAARTARRVAEQYLDVFTTLAAKP